MARRPGSLVRRKRSKSPATVPWPAPAALCCALQIAVREHPSRSLVRLRTFIDDGSTLQIGLGRVPNEALRYLKDRRDLGIHSDVITDGVVDLVEAGVVTGRRKSRHRDRIVASYCLGTRRLYDLIDDNPRFAFLPIDQVCHPRHGLRPIAHGLDHPGLCN